ncbi:MAG: tail fiber domain-containing protein [Dysgonamonadaceae bacterium]|nr:tail fiber domain-containing protein [Dysgonamonadaceae bacterium]
MKIIQKLKVLITLMALMPSFITHAQVKIGQDAEPVKGAVLELNSNVGSGNYVGGLRLPNVPIENVNAIPTGFSENSLNLTEQGNLTGSIVYNTNPGVIGGSGIGIYYWNGSKWIKEITGAIEPWYKVGTTGPSTENYHDSYLMAKVGIGMNNPQYQLHVAGYTRLSDNVWIGGEGDVVGHYYGNLGVGIKVGVNPAAKVHVNGNMLMEGSSPFFRIVGTATNNPWGQSLGMLAFGRHNDMDPGSGNKPHAYIETVQSLDGDIVNGNLKFGTLYNNTASVKMTINGLGNVGIGTDPTHKLHINNGTTNGAIKIVDGTQKNGRVLTTDNNGVGTWQDIPFVTVTADNGLTPTTVDRTTTIKLGGTLKENTTINTGSYNLIFGNAFDYNRVYFNNGNVGIGTNTSSGHKLHVYGSTNRIDDKLGIRIDPLYNLHVQGESHFSNHVWIGNLNNEYGNLGVGITPGTSPASRVHINGDLLVEKNVPFLRMVSTTTDNPGGRLGILMFGRNNAMRPFYGNGYGSTHSPHAFIDAVEETNGSTKSGKMRFGTGRDFTGTGKYDGVEGITMVIDGIGNVGVGTESPTHKFHIVTGNRDIYQFRYADPAAGFKLQDGYQKNKYVLTSDDNGVGTWQPAQGGSVGPWNRMRTEEASVNNQDSSYLMARVAIGFDRPKIIHGDHAQFTVVGGDASINGITVGTGKGDYIGNVAVGYQALDENTPKYTGNQSALGVYNTAVGASALQKNVSGSRNTAIGNTALMNLDSDKDPNDRGDYNTAIGNAAGWGIKNGTENVTIGHDAMGRGEEMGGKTPTDGVKNRNTAIGTNTACIFDSGHNNTIIGYGAGADLKTGTNNIMIGAGADTGNGDNKINIGNLIYATGIAIKITSGTDLVYPEPNGIGNVGIGIDNPSQKLHVAGTIRANTTDYTSDERWKKDIATISDPLSIIEQLRGTSYKFRTDEFPANGFKEGKQLGVIAQEIEKVLPELVSEDTDGFKSVNYDGLIPVLIEGMKAQQSQIESLLKLVESQQKINEQLEARLKALEAAK